MLDATYNDWDFPVELQPAFLESGEEIPNLKAMVRTDTMDVLGHHSDRYQHIPYEDIRQVIVDAVHKADISSDFEETVTVIEGGRKLKVEVLFPDINIEPVVGDYSSFRIQAFSSYDGMWAFQQTALALRWWCTNGMVTPDMFAKVWGKHTKNINLDASAGQIVKGMDTFMNSLDDWKRWMKVNVTNEDVEHLFKNTLCNIPNPTSTHKWNQKQLEILMNQWDQERAGLGQNKWALYNTMTYWSTHTHGSSNPHVLSRTRQNQVTSAMNHRLFYELT